MSDIGVPVRRHINVPREQPAYVPDPWPTPEPAREPAAPAPEPAEPLVPA